MCALFSSRGDRGRYRHQAVIESLTLTDPQQPTISSLLLCLPFLFLSSPSDLAAAIVAVVELGVVAGAAVLP